MKKAKILVPAMGMMLLSTAAAVSGTMAWFTANRTVSMSTTNFAVEALDGNLTIAYENIEGTEEGTGAAAGKIVAKGNLGDASFDEVTSTLYTDVANDDPSLQPTQFVVVDTLANAVSDGNTDEIWDVGANYYALAWKFTITYAFGADKTSLDLFFDYDNSVATPVTGATTGLEAPYGNTQNGFRLAMMCGNEKIVWAPFRASSAAANVKRVTSTSAATTYSTAVSEGQYKADVIYSDEATALALDSVAANTSRTDYLGTLVDGSGTNSKEITCVAWFEGTDPDVINNSTMDEVSALIRFYTRKAA